MRCEECAKTTAGRCVSCANAGNSNQMINPVFDYHNPYLSRRELFAAMAMQGLLAGMSGKEMLAGVGPSSYALTAVEMADALIEELNEEK